MTTNHAEQWVPEMTFPARLALVRNRMGWNAKEAAFACGLPAQSWRNWEAGIRPRDLVEVAKQIAEHTGCSAAWLAMGDTHWYPSDNRHFLATA